MSLLPICKPKEVIRALEKAGFLFARQRGSHRMYVKGNRGVTVPYHTKDLKVKTLKHIIKQSGLEVDEFLKLL